MPTSCSTFDPDWCPTESPVPGVGPAYFPLRATPGTQMALLINGEISLAARLATLRAAKKSIRIQALLFIADEAGHYVADLLKEKKRAGLEVHVIVDAISNMNSASTQLMYYDLSQNGIGVDGYEPAWLEWIDDVSLQDPTRVNKRFHDKMWVIDGETDDAVAIVGGMNVANEYFRVGPPPDKHWRDQDVILRGDAVADVVAAYDRNRAYFADARAHRPAIFDPHRVLLGLEKILGPIRIPSKRDPALTAIVQAADQRGMPALEMKPAHARFVQSRPRFQETYILQTYVDLMATTTTEILIVNAYFVPTPEIQAAIIAAVARGVQVTILTNSLETCDLKELTAASRYVYQDLMQAARDGTAGGTVSIYEWAGKPFNEGTLHAKFAVFDRERAIVGSYNLDPRSQLLNSETVIAFLEPTLAGQLADQVQERDLAKATRITWEQAVGFHDPAKRADQFGLLLSEKLRADL